VRSSSLTSLPSLSSVSLFCPRDRFRPVLAENVGSSGPSTLRGVGVASVACGWMLVSTTVCSSPG
jgi:hypothetical protein